MKIQARRLLDFTIEVLWQQLTGPITLVFDDGVEVDYQDPKEILYSLYFWEVHRQFPVPLLSSHQVGSVIRGERLKSGTHLRLIGKVVWESYDYLVATQMMSQEQLLALRYRLAEISYEITNNLYNDLIYKTEPFVTSLDITDFMEVLDQPQIMEAYDQYEPNEAGVNNIYKAVYSTLRDKDKLGHNPLSRLVLSELVSEKQVHQVIGVRGLLTDSNSDIFEKPVGRGYAEGLRSFYDTLVESRSATKALLFSKVPVQDAEYFSRRLQLVSMGVANIHHDDCGSTTYHNWTVKGRQFINGVWVGYGNDLRHLAGKFYMADDGQLKEIKALDKHLIGQKIRLRTVEHCRHPDPSGFCSTCFGALSLSIPANSNIGHICSTYMTQQSSQGVLSVKHLDVSASVEAVILSEGDQYYLRVMVDGNSYKLADTLRQKQVSLIIKADAAPTIADVQEVDDVMDLTVSRISNLDYLGVRIDDGKGNWIQDEVEVRVKKRQASMTHDLLSHVQQYGWTTDKNGDYIVDMTNWDWDLPILQLPLRHATMNDHSKEIAEVLESCVDNMIERDRFSSPSAVLGELFTLVNEKLDVNLAVLEVVLYGAMIVSAEDYDYSLPKPWTKSGLGVMRNTMAYRSVSVSTAFERQRDVLINPESYVLTNRPDHLFDYLLMPRELTEARKIAQSAIAMANKR